MNSLQELNSATGADSTVEYTDTRLPTVIFDLENPGQVATLHLLEGVDHTIPVAINVIEIVNYSVANLLYTIDLRNCPGALVNWAAMPVHMSVDNTTDDVYVVSGFKSADDWNYVKEGVIQTPSGYSGTFEYIVRFDYFDKTQANLKQFTVLTIVENVETLTQPLDFIFNISSLAGMSEYPQIQESGVTNPTYTVVVTPSNTANISSLSTVGTGGTSSYNSTAKTLTIVGTKTQVNTHLATIQLGTTSLEADFIFTYTVSNNLTVETDTKFQTMRCSSINYLANPTETTVYYNEDTVKVLTGVPVVRDTAYDGSGTYTYTVYPNTTSAVSTLSSTGTGGSSSFNNTSKVLTITGTRTQVNSHLSNISYTPATDYASNFLMYYKVVTPRGSSATGTKFQNMYIGSNDTEITNMNIGRGYSANNYNFIFSSNTPYISDADTSNPSYSISFTINASYGKFSLGRNSTTYSTLTLTGTKDYLNGLFSQIIFYPVKNSYSSASFTYQQRKNGTLQVNQTVSLSGSNASWSDTNTVYTFTSTGVWTPTYEEVTYGGLIDLILVGGGGGGAYGGGAGGDVYSGTNISISQTTYSFTVGSGGLAASTYWPGPETGAFSYIGSSGGTTSGFGYSAAGGNGGHRDFTPPSSYTIRGGNNSLYNGGTGAPAVYLGSSELRTGGGGAGSNGNGTNGSINQGAYTVTRGLGGAGKSTFIGTVGSGGAGGLLRVTANGTITNSAGDYGTEIGGGGGGSQGYYSTTSSSPSNGRAGAVGIKVHS